LRIGSDELHVQRPAPDKCNAIESGARSALAFANPNKHCVIKACTESSLNCRVRVPLPNVAKRLLWCLQEQRHVFDKQLRILELRSVIGIGIKDELGILVLHPRRRAKT
jgi:hypothetical protein